MSGREMRDAGAVVGSGGSAVLPTERLEAVRGWGGAVGAAAFVYRPSTLAQLTETLALARATHRTVTLRGAGRSYGDASLGRENIVIELTRMNRILDWDPVPGLITCQAGVTIEQIWRHVIEDGWWPPVVSGTMFPTVGGILAMNIHGKNNFKVGPIGDHVVAFEMLTAQGETIRVTRESDNELFHAVIGSFGQLGIITSATFQMKKVYSGDLDVKVFVTDDLHGVFDVFERQLPESDYLVGWIDAFASGRSLGRSVIHQANYLAKGVDPMPAQTLRMQHQDLPDTIMGLVPKSIVWLFLRPFTNRTGMKLVNWAKWVSSKISPKKQMRQAHAAFAFLLDYVPNWKRSYGPHGLIQFQSFIPKAGAESAFSAQLQLCQRESLVPLLAVFKRHRPDGFLMTHAVDGYSLALDFKVTARNRAKLWQLTERLNRITLDAGGRFYMAKDATLTQEAFREYLGEETLTTFRKLKARLDPDGLFSTELSKRLFNSGS